MAFGRRELNMTGKKDIIVCLRQLLDSNPALRNLVAQSLASAAQNNPHICTNPVRSLEDWFVYLERFLHQMPWQTMDIGEDASFFRRIDQNIGYFYYLLDQPIETLKHRGYWYPSLQYEPHIAAWLAEYNKAWGEWLSSADSWNNAYYQLARTDHRFELDTDRYESPDHWHCWNDFFARKLNHPLPVSNHRFISPSDGLILDYPVKTISTNHLQDLLGESPYAERFEGGEAIHIVLDVNDYHRFHAPCAGRVVEQKIIPGIHAGGGVIIWDEEQGRYRYDTIGAIGFQSLETRGILILDTPDFGYIALIAVGIQQVSSVQWSLREGRGEVVQGEEIGCFQFGGSDIILLFESSGKAPAYEPGKTVRVGDKWE